jgi:hypothetical protein
VVDVIKGTTPFKYAIELAKFPDVTTRVEWHFHISAQAKADFVRLVWEIAGNYVMTTAAQFGNQAGADGS